MSLADGELRAGLAGVAAEEVERLAALCREHDGIALPLNLEPAGEGSGELNQLVYYAGDLLVGAVTLFGKSEVELSGMVHPSFRRRGLGRALLQAALEECRRREASDVLVVCEQSSAPGVAFVEAAGGRLRFCEYRMELDVAGRPPLVRRHPALALHRAGPADADTLVDLTARAFADPVDMVRRQIVRWLARPDQRFYLGVLGDEPVGALRVSFEEDWAAIYTFGVLPEHRGQGYGRQMLSETVELLLAEGWTQISLEVETENSNALGLYQSCGFRETTIYGYYEGLGVRG